MRKIIESFDNPIDNILIKIAEFVCPTFKYYNFTPNMITTISLFFGLISIKLVYDKQYKLGSLFFMIAYFFDCLDGHYARKYNMETIFGDYYDHFSDISKVTLMLYVVYLKKPEILSLVNILIFLMLLTLMSTHLGCQELHYDKDTSPSLKSLRNLCYDKNDIIFTRWFGVGTFITLICAMLYYIDFSDE